MGRACGWWTGNTPGGAIRCSTSPGSWPCTDSAPGPTAEFLKCYGRLRAADRVCLDDARWAFDYVQWLWYRSRFPDPAQDGARHAEGLAQRLLRCNN